MKLKNTLFIFDSEEEYKNFWRVITQEKNSEIMYNTFLVTKHKWILRLIIWLLK